MDNSYIPKIVKASGVKAHELILIHFWGEDSDRDIALEFVNAVAALGASPVLLQQSRSANRELFQNAADTSFDEKYFSLFSSFDAILDIFAYRPVVLGYEIDADKYELYRRYMTQLFSQLMKVKRFTQIRIPTEANAVESALPAAVYKERMERAYCIDYDALLTSCTQLAEELAKHEQIVIQTGRDCRLFFDLTGRRWHIDAGDGDWPCGEIYIAPNEGQTNGTIFFDRLFIDDFGVFSQVSLQIEGGRITGSDHADVKKFFTELSCADSVVCELGFGMNPGVTDLCGYTVLDEKMACSFHIAIGANNMFGGQNAASLHMDLVHSGSFAWHPASKKDAVFSYFGSELTNLRSREQILSADERGDEAIFVKVRANIFNAFRSVFSAGIKVCGNDEEKLESFFLSRIEQISQNWRGARKEAEIHADTQKLYLEDVKLKACADIREAFIKIWRKSL